ncbi:hypothetical protein N9026_00235 [bacterium]|nr:hypothetical protein [bacterium]
MPKPYDSPYKQQKTFATRSKLIVEAGVNVPKRVKQSDGTTPRVGLGPIEQSPHGWAASEKRKLSKGK